MKRLRVGALSPITVRSVREEDVKLELRPENCYIVERKGLRPWPSSAGHVNPPSLRFHVAACRFGGDSTSEDFHPAVRCFVDSLKALGVKPEYERDEDGPNFCFWFDLSSRSCRAYYSLGTANHGQEIISSVFAEKLDEDIEKNLKTLDRELYALIKKCGVVELP